MAVNSKEIVTDGLYEQVVKQLIEEFTPKEAVRGFNEIEARAAVQELSLAAYVEATSKLKLEPWQIHLCNNLQSLTYTRGRRILIHKPPQHGGSVIVSQRLPSYLIGNTPDRRVALACYNIEHAVGFTGINKTIMQSAEYRNMFQNEELLLPSRASDKQFFTKARRSHRDGQASISALGLLSGFVGKGVDDLIIDDPYASPQDAMSKATCKSVWQFWSEGARVRIDDNANVIVMFHRYHEDDFVGQLIQEEGLKSMGGVWELISYRAEWDGDENPKIGGPDPMKRKKGEYLSPRKASQPGYYRDQKRNPSVWQSQFQGKPSKADGTMFKVSKLIIVPRPAKSYVKIARAWDVASTEDGDYSVGVKMGLADDDYVDVLDVIRFRKDTDERNKIIRRTANRDRAIHPDIVTILPQDPGGAGKDLGRFWVKLMKGHTIKVVLSFNRGNKEQKADPWSDYVNSGFVRLVCAGDIFAKDDNDEYIFWVVEFIDEHRRFLAQKTDDQVDAASDCFSEIALEIDNPPGEEFDTIGIYKEFSDYMSNNNIEETQQELYNEWIASSTDKIYLEGGELHYGSSQGKEINSRNVNKYSTIPTRSEHQETRREYLQQTKRRRIKYK